MKKGVLISGLLAAGWLAYGEESVANSASLSGCSFDTRTSVGARRYKFDDQMPRAAWNNTENWVKGGDSSGANASVRLTSMDPVDAEDVSTWTVLGETKTLAFGKGEGVVPLVSMSGAYRVQLFIGEELRATSYYYCVGDPIVATAVVTDVPFDTRSYQPRCPASTDEILPFVYDTAWWAGDVSSVSVSVVPYTNGAPETARLVALSVTNTVGTSIWQPEHRELYLAMIVPATGEPMTVFIDTTDVKELPLGVLQGDGSILFTNLRDAGGVTNSLTVPKAWLDETKVDLSVACSTVQKGPNGLPVWESYVLGLDPNAEPFQLLTTIQPADEETFTLVVESLTYKTTIVKLMYELWSTDDIGTDFKLYLPGQLNGDFGELEKDGSQRFYRAKVKIYWK